MTLARLQHYLDLEKWNESAKRGHDMCGRYARCRYCDRFAQHPCALAHNKLIAEQEKEEAEPIPEWLVPEPPVSEEQVARFDCKGEKAERVPVVNVRSKYKEGRVRVLQIARNKK